MTDYVETEGLPLELRSPPVGSVDPPLETKVQLAPLDQLTWEAFEQICVAVALEEGEPKRVRRYGVGGQAQEGIDIFARLADRRYAVYQCRRTQGLAAASIEDAVADFRDGDWFDRADRFIICTSASARRTERADTIETETDRLAEDGIEFGVWDAEELSRRLKLLPVVVLDFFGRPWVERFCSLPLPAEATDRLDGPELQELRGRLSRFYRELFDRHDPSLAIRDAVALPVLRRRRMPTSARGREEGPAGEPDTRTDQESSREDTLLQERLPLASWLSRGRRSLLLGSAGAARAPPSAGSASTF